MKWKSKNVIVAENKELRIERRESEEVIAYINQYLANENSDKALLSVIGLPGTGKSVLLQMVRDKVNEEQEKGNVFLCYVDISDCADEIEVYFKIARELQIFFEKNGALQNSSQDIAINQFLQIHEWIDGRAGTYPVQTSAKDSWTEGISTIYEEMKELLGKQEPEEIEKDSDKQKSESNSNALGLEAAFAIFSKVATYISYAQIGKALLDIAVKTKREYQLKVLLQETLEAFHSKVKREALFRKMLQLAMPGGGNARGYKPVIILDNFQLEYHNSLGRDHTWISKTDGIMKTINALWIIAGRSPITIHFRNVFELQDIYDEIELQGFEEDEARKYLCHECRKTNLDYLENRGDIPGEILDKMLLVCRTKEHHYSGQMIEDTKDIYLPYLLRLVALHYKKLAEDPACKIKPELFVDLEDEQEFVGYYFYKDLSDLMINAFQILCCLPNWDGKWIEIVRARFDNHLLNAEYQLRNTAPIEDLKDGRLKLHEAIREGLYNSSRNYIKHDVLKYLFQTFIRIYGEPGEEASQHPELWYQSERLSTFMEIVYEYIKEKEIGREKCIEEIKKAIDNIYEANGERGTISESFIRLYTRYIDILREIYHVPFIILQHVEFKEENLENFQELIKNAFQSIHMEDKRMDDVLYYMEGCLKLANLYTYYNAPDVAIRIEKLCLVFWEKFGELYSKSDIEFWQCREQQIKALNAIAYDSSAEHDYETAYGHGRKGLGKLQETIEELLNQYLPEWKEFFDLLINPEKKEDFSIDSCIEIQDALYQKLIEIYKKLFDWRNVVVILKRGWEKESYKKKIQKIIAELLLVDQQNLRGNYPWYCQKMKNSALSGDEYWKFGARTYWMRRAILETAELRKEENLNHYKKKMIISYHNVGVYLAKLGNVEQACILEREVLEEGRRLLSNDNALTLKMQERIERIQSSKNSSEYSEELMVYLWEHNGFAKEKYEDYFLENEQLLEQKQYIGDYYLHMGFYELAVKYLTDVSLKRYIRFGELDSKTLDSVIRLLIAAYAKKKDDLTKLTAEFIYDRILKNVNVTELNSIAFNIRDKLMCLKELLVILEQTEISDTDKLERMLYLIDK